MNEEIKIYVYRNIFSEQGKTPLIVRPDTTCYIRTAIFNKRLFSCVIGRHELDFFKVKEGQDQYLLFKGDNILDIFQNSRLASILPSNTYLKIVKKDDLIPEGKTYYLNEISTYDKLFDCVFQQALTYTPVKSYNYTGFKY